MENVLELPQIFESSRGRKRRGLDRHTWQPSDGGHGGGPWRPTRREAIIAGAVGLAGLFLFGRSRTEFSQPKLTPIETPQARNPYRNWEQFRNRNLPRETIVAIGEDLENNTYYSGFSEVGKIIIMSQRDPEQLQIYLPPLAGHSSLDFIMTNLQQTRGALAILDSSAHKDNTARVKEKNRQTGKTREYELHNFKTLRHTVQLDNSLAFAPDDPKKLLIVKEISHFLYYQNQRELIQKELQDKYEFEITSVDDLATLFLLNGYSNWRARFAPSLSDSFDHALIDLDGAGYWHTAPAFGQMKAEGLFSQKDLMILASGNEAFEAAIKLGILVPEENKTFGWREGIGPFSPEWTSIMRALHQKFSQQS